ncbi:MAG: Replicative DNA helicase loader DnaI [Moorella sp. 60_41]|nr:MAG: Replicative DNA helicase loader DnaI [Moorella sp. 60_41]
MQKLRIPAELLKRPSSAAEAGPPSSAGSPPPSCPECGDRGIILRDGRAYRCKCMQVKAWHNRLRSAHLTPYLSRHTFATFDLRYYSRQRYDELTGTTYYEAARRCLEACKQFVNQYVRGQAPRGLFIFGPVGSGKTFLAAAVANALTAMHREVLFVVVPDLLDEIRATYDRRPEAETPTEHELLTTARDAPVLILDDLGAHNYTEWTRNKIFSLINYRLIHDLPVVITSNLDLKQLEEYLGERTTSRLLQLCRSYHLPVEQDIRYLLSREGRR